MIASSALHRPKFPDAYDIVVEFGGGNASAAVRSLERRRAPETGDLHVGDLSASATTSAAAAAAECRPLLYMVYDLPVVSALQTHLLQHIGFTTFTAYDTEAGAPGNDALGSESAQRAVDAAAECFSSGGVCALTISGEATLAFVLAALKRQTPSASWAFVAHWSFSEVRMPGRTCI